MATIKDVAREASVSIGTVSKALNGSYTISEGQIRHVKEVAERLGYRANARAQTFARRESRTAVFLTALPKGTAFENPHMFEIICGAESALREKGYTLTLEHCDMKNICHMAKEIMASKSADGLLIHASVVAKELALMLGREEIPHIVVGKPAFPNSVSWIDNNNQLSGEIAARHLVELGHTRIAYIGGLEEDRISEDRLAGVVAEISSYHQPKENDLYAVYKSESSIAEGKRIGREVLALSERPQAVICANNHLAYGCLRAFQRENVRVPDDISIMTFDDYPFALYMNPALTTVSIDVYDMGVQAGKLLINKIKKPGMNVQSFATLPVLVRRQSTAML